jgi:hypothetical protein
MGVISSQSRTQFHSITALHTSSEHANKDVTSSYIYTAPHETYLLSGNSNHENTRQTFMYDRLPISNKDSFILDLSIGTDK